MGGEMSLDAGAAKDCMSKPMGCFSKRKGPSPSVAAHRCPDDAWVAERMLARRAFTSPRLDTLPSHAMAPRARSPDGDLFTEYLEVRSADDHHRAGLSSHTPCARASPGLADADAEGEPSVWAPRGLAQGPSLYGSALQRVASAVPAGDAQEREQARGPPGAGKEGRRGMRKAEKPK